MEIVLVAIAVLINCVASLQYIFLTLKGKTQPHVYTWFVWLLTQGIGVFGMWTGGGGIASWPLTVGLVWISIIVLISIRKGTKNITRGDTYALVTALIAIVVWVFLHNPLLAILMAAGIDTIGFIPSLRKAWEEPWSENVIFPWGLFVIGNICTLLALQEVNFYTASYVVAILLGNAGMAVLLLVRQGSLKKTRGK